MKKNIKTVVITALLVIFLASSTLFGILRVNDRNSFYDKIYDNCVESAHEARKNFMKYIDTDEVEYYYYASSYFKSFTDQFGVLIKDPRKKEYYSGSHGNHYFYLQLLEASEKLHFYPYIQEKKIDSIIDAVIYFEFDPYDSTGHSFVKRFVEGYDLIGERSQTVAELLRDPDVERTNYKIGIDDHVVYSELNQEQKVAISSLLEARITKYRIIYDENPVLSDYAKVINLRFHDTFFTVFVTAEKFIIYEGPYQGNRMIIYQFNDKFDYYAFEKLFLV